MLFAVGFYLLSSGPALHFFPQSRLMLIYQPLSYFVTGSGGLFQCGPVGAVLIRYWDFCIQPEANPLYPGA